MKRKSGIRILWIIVAIIIYGSLFSMIFFYVFSNNCSMDHFGASFDQWWRANSQNYLVYQIEKEDFQHFSCNDGMPHLFSLNYPVSAGFSVGDIVARKGGFPFIVHRVMAINNDSVMIMADNNFGTKDWFNEADGNFSQAFPKSQVLFKVGTLSLDFTALLSYPTKCFWYFGFCRLGCIEQASHSVFDCSGFEGLERDYCLKGALACQEISNSGIKDNCFLAKLDCGNIQNSDKRENCQLKKGLAKKG